MTITSPTADAALTYDLVTLDLYRDIHKAIRAELFAITVDAGRTDPACELDRRALAAHVGDVATLLVEHAEHEDGAIQPVLEARLPDLAAQIESDHHALEARIERLRDQAATEVASDTAEPRRALHRLYVELAAFTSAYLAHQDTEERVVMPALETAVGIEECVAIHQAIVGPMPPDQMARSLALMLPAMNVEDRTEFFGGLSAGAPPEVVEGVWSLAASVLTADEHRTLAGRFGR